MRTKSKPQNVIKVGRQTTAVTNYNGVQYATVYEDANGLVVKAPSGTIYPFSRPQLITNPAQDGRFITRIGSTAIFADNGGAGSVGVLSFKLWQFTEGGGKIAFQGVARISVGPDATILAATKGEVSGASSIPAGGSYSLAEVTTAADGEFTANVTFNAGGVKIVTISFGQESYNVSVNIP